MRRLAWRLPGKREPANVKDSILGIELIRIYDINLCRSLPSVEPQRFIRFGIGQ